MLVYAGIDEAGYGPMLGPLCVAATVFVIPEHDPGEGAPNLWRMLNGAVCRKKSDRRRRIAVDDSKKLKLPNDGGTHPLKCLERGVLAFRGDVPADDATLLISLEAAPPNAPWYGSTTPLPLAHTADELRIAGSRLNRALESRGITCAMMQCEVIDAGPFNDSYERTGSKASVNMAAALRLVQRIWQRWPDSHPRIILDRHGGRVHYREELQLAWPDAHLRIISEDAGLSRYRLGQGDSQATITFRVNAEQAHLPVALASMTAKLTRELMMLRLNRFFRQHLPELKPTAGYVQDARRYLEEIDPVIRRLQLPRDALVRRA